MNVPVDLTSAPDPSEPPPPPHVFTRLFTVPAGAPWDQSRAARLEIVHGSPLPVSELMWRVRRLESWAPGKTARFAAFYIRRREFTAPFETTVQVDGRTLSINFGGGGGRNTDLSRVAPAALMAGLIALVLLIGGSGTMLALNARAEADAQLSATERRVAVRKRQAQGLQRLQARDAELRTLTAGAAPLEQVLADLAWTAAVRAPDARIQAFHWDRGLIAVEARGEDSPFVAADRSVQRSREPVRPGVWLWGVSEGAGQ